MAISDIEVRPTAQTQKSKEELLAEAVQILDPQGQILTKPEIISRLERVKELLCGLKASRVEREKLIRTLIDIAIRQPNSDEETGILIGDISESLASRDDYMRHKRDAHGKIIPVTDEAFPPRVLEQLSEQEGEAE